MDQRFSKVQAHILNMRSKLAPHILSMTMGELQAFTEKGVTTFEQLSEIHAQNNRPLPAVNNTTITARSARAASRNDDGKSSQYLFRINTHAHIYCPYWSVSIVTRCLLGELTLCIFSVLLFFIMYVNWGILLFNRIVFACIYAPSLL